MARYTGPACRLCRREGRKLYLKGERCLTGKCALDRRNSAPGQHGAHKANKANEYRLQLREKQTAKRYYGVQEKQFRTYFEKADNTAGVTGENLLSLLERRLDNVVYKMGMAASRKEARQLVRHAHFTLNGKKVTIPSIIVKVGDVVTVKEESKSSEKIKALLEIMQTKATPKWLELDATNASIKVVAVPERSDVDFEFNEQLIVELYSK